VSEIILYPRTTSYLYKFYLFCVIPSLPVPFHFLAKEKLIMRNVFITINHAHNKKCHYKFVGEILKGLKGNVNHISQVGVKLIIFIYIYIHIYIYILVHTPFVGFLSFLLFFLSRKIFLDSSVAINYNIKHL
jgi:hypothetical protein